MNLKNRIVASCILFTTGIAFAQEATKEKEVTTVAKPEKKKPCLMLSFPDLYDMMLYLIRVKRLM